MTVIDRNEQVAGAVAVEDLGELATIFCSDVQLATWRRRPDDAIEALARAVSARMAPCVRRVVRTDRDDLRDVVAGLLPAEVSLLDDAAASRWRDDLVRLCEAFADLMQTRDLVISLEVPNEATCPRFHVDRVGIRLLVTYCGPGTEWLASCDVDRHMLGPAGHARSRDQDLAMRPGARVRRVEPFSVILLKGEAWPGAAGRGAVHRSPDPKGAPRVLLRVDLLRQVDDVDQEVPA